MSWKENRKLAWGVLVVCIVGSVVGLGGASLVRERNSLMNVFYSGTESSDTARHSMDAYLDRAVECANIMAAEAQLYLGNDCEAAERMCSAVADCGDDDALDLRYSAYTRMQKESDELYNAMYAASLSDAERVNFKRAYDDFWGSDKYIRKDPYREKAADFNSSIQSFPANAVAALMGVDELNSFGVQAS